MFIFNVFPCSSRFASCFLMFLFLWPFAVRSQVRIADSVQAILKNTKTAGAAVAVLKNGNLLYSVNYGYSDLEQGKPVSDDTGFGIMSLSKNIVASAVMQLVYKHKIDLDAAVTSYIPDLPSSYKSVKVYQLLNHTSGVPDYVHVKGYMQQADKTQQPLELLSPVLKDTLEFNPGFKSGYSNSNYILLGLIIEKASSQKLKDYLSQNIFLPIGMKHTYLEDEHSDNAGKAKGYTLQNNKLVYQPPLDPSQYWAAGGIVSTKTDLLIYDEALRSGRLLPLNIVKQMIHPIKLDDGKESEYGLGFELMQTPELEIAGNTGVGLGYNAAYLNFLKDSIVIIVLTNTTNGRSGLIAKQIHDLLSPKQTATENAHQDPLDAIVLSVFKDAGKGSAEPSNFQSTETLKNFTQNTMPYIQQQGGILKLEQQGEKINPETIVRRYKINFEHSSTTWVIIFSKEGQIIMANHM